MAALQSLIARHLTSERRLRHISVGVGEGAAIAWLHAHGTVNGERVDGEVMQMDVRLSDADFARFEAGVSNSGLN